MKPILLATILLAFFLPVFAATGCDLNDPDRDVKRFFPESTSFKSEYVSIADKGGNDLYKRIEQRLGDKMDGMYETPAVPYTMYRIYEKNTLIGYIHGVNQRGKYGGIQVFLALNTEGVIKGFYLQRFTSIKRKILKEKEFANQFRGLTPADFAQWNPKTGKGKDKVAAIKNMAPDADDDFQAIMRGVKKNLILMDEFLLNHKYRDAFE